MAAYLPTYTAAPTHLAGVARFVHDSVIELPSHRSHIVTRCPSRHHDGPVLPRLGWSQISIETITKQKKSQLSAYMKITHSLCAGYPSPTPNCIQLVVCSRHLALEHLSIYLVLPLRLCPVRHPIRPGHGSCPADLPSPPNRHAYYSTHTHTHAHGHTSNRPTCSRHG